MSEKISPIGDIVKNVFTQIESGKNIFQEEIEESWKKTVGEVALKHSKPMVLRKNILTVFVDSSVWMHELHIQKRKILKALQRIYGKDRISEIHFKLGEF